MASRSAGRKILFVARDFATPGLEEALQALVRAPTREYELRAPGVVSEGGEILRDVVVPGIVEASRVLVFADKPNANVGFEAGLAIGLGKPTVLVGVGNDLQPWLEHPPVINTLVHRLERLSDLHKLIEDQAIWQQLPLGAPKRATRGRAPTTKFLCPSGSEGARYLSVQQELQPFWQRPPVENFTLRDLPWFFADAVQVVWAIVQPETADAERDGIGNACNAIVAGWFCAHLLTADTGGGSVGDIRERWGVVKRGLRVLRSTLCRPIRDVELLERTFEGLGDFVEHIRQIPVADLAGETKIRPLWLLQDTANRSLPETLREQVHRMQTRAVELTAGGEFDRALDELRAGDELSAALVVEWPDDVRLKLSRGYLLKTLAQVLIHSGNTDFSSQAADRAAKSFQDALQGAAAAGIPKIELAEAINGLGNLSYSQGRLDQAIECYRQATELFPQYAAAWHDLFGAYLQLRAHRDVDVRLLREAFDRMKEYGQGLPGLSSIYIASLEKRLKVLERPMGAEEKMFSSDAAELADAIADELVRRDDGDEATAAFTRRLTLAARERQYRSLVEGLTELAQSFRKRGKDHAAEHPLRAALGIANALGDHLMCARQCLHLARYYMSSNYDDKIRMGGGFAQKALTLYDGLSDDRGRADALRYLAIVHTRVGDLQEAERNNRAALGIYERLGLRTEAYTQACGTARLLVELARSQEAANLLQTWRRKCKNLVRDAEAVEYDKWLGKNLARLIERDHQVDQIRAVLKEFDAHLRDLGLQWSGAFPFMRIVDDKYVLGSYDPRRNVLLLGTNAIGDIDIALKEYVYRAFHAPLFTTRPEVAEGISRVATAGAAFAVGALLSGVATYFACSYRDDSGFARTVARLWGGVQLTELAIVRNMKDVPSVPDHSDSHRRVETVQKAGEVWGSALWAIRKELGRSVADRLVAGAWQEALESSDDAEIASRFARALVDQSGTGGTTESIHRHLETHGIEIALAR